MAVEKNYRWPVGLCLAYLIKMAGLVLIFDEHTLAGWIAFFAPDPWFFWNFFVPSAGGLGPTVTRFRPVGREVWLTIDDGPDPITTPHMLAELKKHGARATFFLIGEKAARHPDLIAEIIHHGHTVGNHSHTHPTRTFWGLSLKRLRAEIDRCTEAIRNSGIEPSPWFRGPVGLKNILLYRELAHRGLTLVHWSHRGYDTRNRQPNDIVEDITRDLKPGGIILFHEHAPSLAANPAPIELLLAHLKRDGFSCVIPSAEQLLTHNQLTTAPGVHATAPAYLLPPSATPPPPDAASPSPQG